MGVRILAHRKNLCVLLMDCNGRPEVHILTILCTLTCDTAAITESLSVWPRYDGAVVFAVGQPGHPDSSFI